MSLNIMNSNDKFEIYDEFLKLMQDPNIAVPVAAIQVLTDVIRRTKATTMMGVEIELRAGQLS